MLKIKFLIILVLFLTAHIVLAQDSLNAGFVSGLWYSETPFFDGDEIRIYTVIQNQSGFDIIGEVQFFDNNNLLGQSEFSIVNGRLIEKWTDWKPVQGNHSVSVKIVNTKKIEIGKNPESIELLYSSIVVSEEYDIDLDTDSDGIGNRDDLDDDGDGFSDEEEKEMGTNSLVFDKPIIKEAEEFQSEDNSVVGSKSSEDDIAIENVTEKTTQLASAVVEKTKEIVEDTKEFLVKQKEKVDEELAQAKKEEDLKDTPKIDEDKNPYLASLVGSIPKLKEVYSFFLATLIYILNSWWILLGSVIVLVYLIWKIIKRRLRKRF